MTTDACTGAAGQASPAMLTLEAAILANTEVLNRMSEQFAYALSAEQGASTGAEGEAAGLAPSGGGSSGGGAMLGGLLGGGASGDTLVGGSGSDTVSGGDSLSGGGSEDGAASGGAADDRVAKEKKAISEIEEAWGGLGDTLDALNGKRVDSDSDMVLSMIGNATKGTKAMAKINAAYAIGETIKNTAMGVQKALADTPFPMNIAQAAFVAAQGVKNIATIKGQFHDGIASVPSTGTYLLERGERVVDRRLNGDLKAYLGAMQSKTAAPSGPTIQMTVNGNPDTETLDRTRDTVVRALRDAYTERGMMSPI